MRYSSMICCKRLQSDRPCKLLSDLPLILPEADSRHGLTHPRLQMRPLTRECAWHWQWYNNTLSAFTCLSTYMCKHERGKGWNGTFFAEISFVLFPKSS